MINAVDIPGLPNAKYPAPGYISGGQPDQDQLASAVHAGLRRVINLRPTSEDAGYDEASLAAELGVEYHVVPVAGPHDLTPERVRRLDELLAQDGLPTLLHCASGARVAAMMALRAGWIQGAPRARALEIGRRWGMLAKMEALVGTLLDRMP